MPPPEDFEVIVSSDISADVVTAAVSYRNAVVAEIFPAPDGFSVTFYPGEDGTYRSLPLGPIVQCLDDGRKRLERLGFGETRRNRDKRTIVPPQ